MAVRVSASSSPPTTSAASVSFNRHSTAIAPCPTAGRKTSGDSVSVMRPLQPNRSKPRFREHHRLVLPALHFSQTRIHIPAQIAHVQIRPDMPKLRLPSKASGADSRALAQTRERRAVRRNQTISNIFAPAHRRKHQPRRCVRRNVLDAVHRQVDRFLQQRFFQFLDEDSLPADLRQRRRLQLIARCLDNDDLGFHSSGRRKVVCAQIPPAISQASCRACRCAGVSRLLPVRQKKIAQRFHVLDLAAKFFLTAQPLAPAPATVSPAIRPSWIPCAPAPPRSGDSWSPCVRE